MKLNRQYICFPTIGLSYPSKNSCPSIVQLPQCSHCFIKSLLTRFVWWDVGMMWDILVTLAEVQATTVESNKIICN